ncbi:MAG: hypothetical protein SVQ76_01340 [Candidatus Nanohaloarchaea archaeon]|nr:hypothetical protein [Candidatus Nanohaloarchaea archaeon]
MALTRRKGVVHTLESLIAAMMFLFFVLAIGQQVDTAGGGANLELRTRHILTTLDSAGDLRKDVLQRNLSEVEDALDNYTSSNMMVAGLYLNQTAFSGTFSGTHSRDFSVHESMTDREILRVWYRDADSPVVEINGEVVDSLSGTVSDYRSYDISGNTVNGSNTLNISVDSSSTLGYSLELYERKSTGTPPEATDLFTTSYMVSGWKNFSPAEVTVVSWR